MGVRRVYPDENSLVFSLLSTNESGRVQPISPPGSILLLLSVKEEVRSGETSPSL